MRMILLMQTVLLLACSAPKAFATDLILGPALDYAVIDPKDIEFTVQQVSQPLYPFQAVRLRLTVRNISNKRLGPVKPVDDHYEALVKGPKDDNDRGIRVAAVTLDRNLVPLSARPPMNRFAPLFLEPGERMFVSFAPAAAWGPTEGGERLAAKPIFPAPGAYWLKCFYLVDPLKGTFIEKSVEIKVSAPQGTDRAVCDLLQSNRALVAALLHPMDPPEEWLVPRLKELIVRFPNSSYLDYARFALARAYLKTSGLGGLVDEDRRAFATEQLAAITAANRFDPQLGKLVPNRFAYLPYALILMSQADPANRKNHQTRLQCEHPDSLEWIEQFAGIIRTAGVGNIAMYDPIEELEDLLNQKLPTDSDELRYWRVKEWRSFRKRVPEDPDKKRLWP